MKKLLLLGLMSLAVMGGFAQEGWAWGRGCCRGRCWGCNRYTTTLCIRPYNAFSPVAYGNIVADGCMPINLYGGQLPPMGGCCAPPMCMPSCFVPNYGGGCCSSGCCENGSLPAPGSFAGAPMMPIVPGQPLPQGQPGQSFTPPAPTPIGQSSYMMPMQPPVGYGYGPVQPAGYMPGYQPMYNPYYNPMYGYGTPNQGQMPGYWYGH
jgi:hypothetical protein